MFAPLKTGTTATGRFTLLKTAFATVMLMALSGCSWFQFPGVYRINIQQGNIVTQEMVDQLQQGMTKRQVNFVLGTALIQDSFNLDRWDYYYSLTTSKGDFIQRKFTVYFQDDKLIRTEGEFKLDSPPTPDEEFDELEELDETFSSNQRNESKTSNDRSAAL